MEGPDLCPALPAVESLAMDLAAPIMRSQEFWCGGELMNPMVWASSLAGVRMEQYQQDDTSKLQRVVTPISGLFCWSLG